MAKKIVNLLILLPIGIILIIFCEQNRMQLNGAHRNISTGKGRAREDYSPILKNI